MKMIEVSLTFTFPIEELEKVINLLYKLMRQKHSKFKMITKPIEVKE